MTAPTLCTTPGCLKPASHYGLCWQCHGDTRSTDHQVRQGIKQDIMEGASVADEAYKQSREVMGQGGMEQASRLLQAAGLNVNPVAMFSRPQSEIKAMMEYAQGMLSGHSPANPLLGPGESSDGIPLDEDFIRNADIPFMKREPKGDVGHPNYDVAWLRRLGFDADLEDEFVIVTVKLDEIVTETERLADVIDGSGRTGSVITSFRARNEHATMRWDNRDIGVKPGQFVLPSGS